MGDGAARFACALACGSALALGLLAARPATAGQRIRVDGPAGAPLHGAIVYAIPSVPPSQDGARPKATIDQVHREFVPRDSVVQVGTAVEFPNSDNIRHSVYSFSPAKRFSLKLYAGRPANPVVFDKPGVIVLGCDIHDSMVGWLLVVDTPYFARTDAEGIAELDLPPGDYALHAWHEPMREASPPRRIHIDGGAGAGPIEMRIDPDTGAGPTGAAPRSPLRAQP